MITYICLISIGVLIAVIIYLVLALRIFENRIKNLDKLREDADCLLKEISNRYDKLLHDKKSSEVRVGKIGENLAPFLDGWPYDPNTFRFLGNPIDGIQFSEDKIRFIEIKTGKARLSSTQRSIKDLVLKGKISFVSFRIGEEDCSLIEEDFEQN